jgi:aspartate/methionine/tyrosine aminotransferase
VPSKRSKFDARLNPLAKSLVSRRETQRPLFDLTVSNPTTAGVPYAVDRIRAALDAPEVLGYEPSPFGIGSAREAVARAWAKRGVSVDPARVVLTASTSEAYSFLFKILCDPGDQVLVPAPSYPLFEHLARYESVGAKPYRLSYDGAWHVDVASLVAGVSDRARAIVLVSPNNPTGSYVKRDEIARVAELGLPIISDEVFAAYPLSDDPRRVRSVLETEGATVFALDGLSKFALLPQMKLSWVTVSGPESAVSESLGALELLADTFLSPGAVVQHALPVLLETSEATRHHVLERIRRNLAFVRDLARGTPSTVLDVEGGWYAVLRLPNVRSEEQWVLGLLEDRDVLVQPGWFYDFESEPYVVLSLITPEPVFRDGVRRLLDYVSR